MLSYLRRAHLNLTVLSTREREEGRRAERVLPGEYHSTLRGSQPQLLQTEAEAGGPIRPKLVSWPEPPSALYSEIRTTRLGANKNPTDHIMQLLSLQFCNQRKRGAREVTFHGTESQAQVFWLPGPELHPLPPSLTHPMTRDNLCAVVHQGAGVQLLRSLIEANTVPDIHQGHDTLLTSTREYPWWTVLLG